MVGPGVQIAPNTISGVLGVVDNTAIGSFNETPWDWMYFNLLNPDNSIKLQLQAFFWINDGSKLPTTIGVGSYVESTNCQRHAENPD